MIRTVIFLLSTLLLVGMVGAQDEPVSVDVMRQANAAYLDGDYDTAISLYETMLADGVGDAGVFFNLGNAYYETGQLGLALLNYRRAQQIAPRDAILGKNIALARSERVDFQQGEARWIDRLAVSTQSFLTLPELGWSILATWVLWWAGAGVWALRADWRSALRWPMAMVGAGLLVGSVFFGARYYVQDARPAAVVVDLSTPVMSGPGDDYVFLFQLFAAAEMRILEVRGEWARIVLPDGRQGWVNRKTIEPV